MKRGYCGRMSLHAANGGRQAMLDSVRRMECRHKGRVGVGIALANLSKVADSWAKTAASKFLISARSKLTGLRPFERLESRVVSRRAFRGCGRYPLATSSGSLLADAWDYAQ